MNRSGPTTLVLCLCLIGCAGSKDDKEGATQDEGALSPIASDQRTEVDATSRTDWVGFDLDTGTSIPLADMAANTTWDLAFKRTSVKMNGAAVRMRVVEDDFSALELAPTDGYASDEPSTEAGALETAGLAFHKDPAWYAYDIETHVVSSRGLVYVVETNGGRHFKLKFTDYYNAERLPAFINFQYGELKGAAQ